METLKEVKSFLDIDLNTFNDALNLQKTTQDSLSDQMKTYYSDYLIDNAVPNLVHDQWAQKHPIPKHGGKIIEFRKFSPLEKALTPLEEGVTPKGNTLNVSVITAEIQQYGDYIALSDILLMTAIDNNLVHATKLLGNQAGETLDTVSREVLNSGTSVQYANGEVNARHLLQGGESDDSDNHYMSVDAVRRVVRTLKNNKAKKINGSYVGIIHPDIAHDLMGDKKWEDPSMYAGSTQIFEGEIGKIHGCRFVETTEAKIFHAKDLKKDSRTLTYKSNDGEVVTIDETLSSDDQKDIVGRNVIINEVRYTVGEATSGTITLDEAPEADEDDTIYPGEAGAKGRDVYSTVFLGDDAYGTTELEGGGLENIVKQAGSAGTGDPLDQRSTTGWKATKVTEILVDNYIVRVETASEFESGAN